MYNLPFTIYNLANYELLITNYLLSVTQIIHYSLFTIHFFGAACSG